jgi:putative transposase
MEGLKHYNHAVGQNCFHLVWKVKYAYSFLNRHSLKATVEGIIKLIASEKGWEIYELKVMPDHVHLFIGFPPLVGPSYVVAVLKAKTASALFRNFPWLRAYFRKGHFWSPGKFYRSVGNVTSDVIQNYIKYSQGTWKTSFKQMPAYYQQRKLHSFVA